MSINNSVRVTILFSYKGKKYQPSTLINLDEYLQYNKPITDFFQIIARENNIDRYSYEYEVMELGVYQFSEANGLAQGFCTLSEFDVDGFIQAWKEQAVLKQLSLIAQQQLSIDNLGEHEALRAALMSAYRYGLDQKNHN